MRTTILEFWSAYAEKKMQRYAVTRTDYCTERRKYERKNFAIFEYTTTLTNSEKINVYVEERRDGFLITIVRLSSGVLVESLASSPISSDRRAEKAA